MRKGHFMATLAVNATVIYLIISFYCYIFLYPAKKRKFHSFGSSPGFKLKRAKKIIFLILRNCWIKLLTKLSY